jgi:hypothetical protein
VAKRRERGRKGEKDERRKGGKEERKGGKEERRKGGKGRKREGREVTRPNLSGYRHVVQLQESFHAPAPVEHDLVFFGLHEDDMFFCEHLKHVTFGGVIGKLHPGRFPNFPK